MNEKQTFHFVKRTNGAIFFTVVKHFVIHCKKALLKIQIPTSIFNTEFLKSVMKEIFLEILGRLVAVRKVSTSRK